MIYLYNRGSSVAFSDKKPVDKPYITLDSFTPDPNYTYQIDYINNRRIATERERTEVPGPEPEPPEEDPYTEMAKAIREGVNEV